MSQWFSNTRNPDGECEFNGLHVPGAPVRIYPKYLYLYGSGEPEALLVNNSDEEKQAREKGYDNINATMISNKHLVNWYWDLEDLSSKQLLVFAKEEFDIDLPVDASQDALFKAVLRLSRAAPQNQNRIVLMAHTIKFEYDQTLLDIRAMVEKGCSEVETQVLEL